MNRIERPGFEKSWNVLPEWKKSYRELGQRGDITNVSLGTLFLTILFLREIEERVKSRSPEVRRVKSSEKIKTESEPVVKVKTEVRPVKTEERVAVKSPESKSVFSRLGASEQVKQGVSR